jgi:hypothetical protein
MNYRTVAYILSIPAQDIMIHFRDLVWMPF